MAQSEAFLLWLDMLGYKGWLDRQTDLAAAEAELRYALGVAFQKLTTRYRGDPDRFGIDSLLISDTIMIWSFKSDYDTFLALTILYHVLHCDLCELGLPVRGALARGTLSVRREVPSIILGNAISRCASLEPRLDAYVIGVDHSVIQFFRGLPEREQMGYACMMTECEALKGPPPNEVVVLSWAIAAVPHMLIQHFRKLVAAAESKDASAVGALRAFTSKFVKSDKMIDSVFPNDEYLPRVKEEWDAAQADARQLLKSES